MEREDSMEYTYHNAMPDHHHQYVLPIIAKMITASPKNGIKSRILDLGCGNGSAANFIAQQAGGAEVIGVDTSTTGIQQATSRPSNLRFVQGDIYDLPYDKLGGPFDIAMAVEVIEHLPMQVEFLNVVKKCLKPGGLFILSTPYSGYLKYLAISLLGRMDEHLTTLWEGGHIKFHSVKTLRQLLQSNGFDNVKFQFAGRLPFLWKSMICSAVLKS
jgi:2-polyprenyl-3-methyl-5-hydroxy-6-metoxy-1,4-benzoquinol methylase